MKTALELLDISNRSLKIPKRISCQMEKRAAEGKTYLKLNFDTDFKYGHELMSLGYAFRLLENKKHTLYVSWDAWDIEKNGNYIGVKG